MTARRARRSAYSECPACYARVIFALTAKGSKQVLNYQPDPAGNVAARHEANGGWRARSSPPDEPLVFPETRRMPHWATSPRCAPARDGDGQRAAAQDVVTYLHEYRKEHTS
jgi:hypothetical protein